MSEPIERKTRIRHSGLQDPVAVIDSDSASGPAFQLEFEGGRRTRLVRAKDGSLLEPEVLHNEQAIANARGAIARTRRLLSWPRSSERDSSSQG